MPYRKNLEALATVTHLAKRLSLQATLDWIFCLYSLQQQGIQIVREEQWASPLNLLMHCTKYNSTWIERFTLDTHRSEHGVPFHRRNLGSSASLIVLHYVLFEAHERCLSLYITISRSLNY